MIPDFESRLKNSSSRSDHFDSLNNIFPKFPLSKSLAYKIQKIKKIVKYPNISTYNVKSELT